MAIAGKVAITPGGEWSDSIAYDKLVVVTYNNDLYLSKKANTGVTPTDTENWQLLIKNVTQEQYDNIINGTTTVGNANKLGGKGASEYVSVVVLNEPILEKVKTLADGLYEYKLGGYGYTGSDLPHRNYAWGYATVYVHSNAYREVVLHGYGSLRPVYNHFIDGAWLGWTENATTADLANYLPKRDGTISGSLKFKTVDNGYAEMTKAHGSDFDNGTAIYDYDSTGSYVALVLQRKNGLLRYYDDHGGKDILHTGNKPSGTYTGTGESKTINTGGIGDCAIIWRDDGKFCIATHGGNVNGGYSESPTSNTSALCKNGNIYLAGADSHFNEVGVTYKWRLL